MAGSRFIVTLETKQDEEIEKAMEKQALSKAAIVRLGGYLLAKFINSGRLESGMLDMIREMSEIKSDRKGGEKT